MSPTRWATHAAELYAAFEADRVVVETNQGGDMAESETFAHLEHLKELGELDRSDPAGVAHYVSSESTVS